jgi:hypothetical protein
MWSYNFFSSLRKNKNYVLFETKLRKLKWKILWSFLIFIYFYFCTNIIPLYVVFLKLYGLISSSVFFFHFDTKSFWTTSLAA